MSISQNKLFPTIQTSTPCDYQCQTTKVRLSPLIPRAMLVNKNGRVSSVALRKCYNSHNFYFCIFLNSLFISEKYQYLVYSESLFYKAFCDWLCEMWNLIIISFCIFKSLVCITKVCLK